MKNPSAALALVEDHSLGPWGDTLNPVPYGGGLSPWGTIHGTEMAVSSGSLSVLLPGEQKEQRLWTQTALEAKLCC